MKILFIIVLSLPAFSFCQKTYVIVAAIGKSTTNSPVTTGLVNVNVKETIVINDTAMIMAANGDTVTYLITKKINENKIEVADGSKNYTVIVNHESPIYKQFSGSITIDTGKGEIISFFK